MQSFFSPSDWPFELDEPLSVELPAEGQADAALLARIRHAVGASPLLSLRGSAELRVLTSTLGWSILDRQDQLLAQVRGAGDDAGALRDALDAIARHRALLDLRNGDPAAQLGGEIELRLRHYTPAGAGSPLAPGASGEVDVYFDPDQHERNIFVVELINRSPTVLYPQIFVLGPDAGIQRIYPRAGAPAPLAPSAALQCGLRDPDELLEMYLPPGWEESHDYLKAIVTSSPADLRSAAQQGLDVSPPGVAGAAEGEPRRPLAARPRVAGEWGTATLRIRTVRAPGTVWVAAAAASVPLAGGITMIKPAGFQGQVTVGRWDRAARAAVAPQPPPGLVRHQDLYRPVGSGGTRSLGDEGLVLTLSVDEPSRAAITPDNPLRFALPAATGEDEGEPLALAFDGEDYLFAGYGGDDGRVLEVVSLPEPAGAAAAQPGTRDMRRTVELFIFKRQGKLPDLPALRRAEVVDDEVRYAGVRSAVYRPGERVALFVHGFNSDTKWMVREAGKLLSDSGFRYDHLLTWDYETLGTSAREAGERLARELRGAGFGPGDNITLDVFAHSMGCLVTRSMVELFGGHEFVDRVAFAGPPNRGTRIATLSRGALFAASLLANRATAIAPLANVAATLKDVYQHGFGVVDLALDSPLVKQLNELREPASAPYLIVAGTNAVGETSLRQASRLALKVLGQSLDMIFGEQNDVIIGLSSMHGVRYGRYPALTVADVACDHFSYFTTPEDTAALIGWLRKQATPGERT